jgi:hypothetical protein
VLPRRHVDIDTWNKYCRLVDKLGDADKYVCMDQFILDISKGQRGVLRRQHIRL